MKAWTQQAGYPLVTVSEKGNNLEMTQSRFYSSEISKKSSKDTSLWPIPMESVQEGGKVTKIFFEKKKLSVPRPEGWVKYNYNEAGFYRVQYPVGLLEKLQSQIKNKTLGASDRLGVVRDLFSLSEAGQFSTAQALRFAQGYAHEDDLTVWEEISGGLYAVRLLIAEQPYLKEFDAYCRQLYGPIAKKLGWEKKKGEAQNTSLLRSLVLYQLGSAGDTEIISKAKNIFNKSIAEGKNISPDIRGLVYALVAENGGAQQQKQLMALYKATDVHEEQERIGRSLGNFKQTGLLTKTLEFAMSKQVRSQDAPGLVIAVGRNPLGRELEWQFVQKNWKEITKRYGHGGHLLEWFIAPVARFSSQAKAKEVELFFKKNPAPGIVRTVRQHLERIRSNELWFKRSHKELNDFFKSTSKK